MTEKSKYSRAELRRMAREVIKALKRGDSRGALCLMALQLKTDMEPEDILTKIKEYAK